MSCGVKCPHAVYRHATLTEGPEPCRMEAPHGFYETSVVCPSGPNLLPRCFERHCSHPRLSEMPPAEYFPSPVDAALRSGETWCGFQPFLTLPFSLCFVLPRLYHSHPVSSLWRRHRHSEGFHLLRLHGREAAVWQCAVSEPVSSRSAHCTPHVPVSIRVRFF